MAHESQAKFFNISASSLTSKWVNLLVLSPHPNPHEIGPEDIESISWSTWLHDCMQRYMNSGTKNQCQCLQTLFCIRCGSENETGRGGWRGDFIKHYLLHCTWSCQVGDGERLVKALFALARELQPSIIFLGKLRSTQVVSEWGWGRELSLWGVVTHIFPPIMYYISLS